MGCSAFSLTVFSLLCVWVTASPSSNQVIPDVGTRLSESLALGRSWLWNRRDGDYGWGAETHRVITVMQLIGQGLEVDNNLDAKMTMKQLELQLALALAKTHHEPLTSGQLALYINGLLTLCKNPRDFHGLNLVSRLHHFHDDPTGYPFALTALTLCNAHVHLTEDTKRRLAEMASAPTVDIPDTRALSVLALSCIDGHGSNRVLNSNQAVRTAIRDFKESQRQDGGFGNIYSSALVYQALFAAGANEAGWNRTRALEYFLNQQNHDGSFGPVLASFFTLPVLAKKSLASIRNINCSHTNQRESLVHEEIEIINLPSGVNTSQVAGTVIVEVAIWVDNSRTDFRTLRVQNGTSLYHIINSQFTSEWRSTSLGPMLVSLNGFTQEPTTNRYWMFYTIEKNADGAPFEKPLDTGAQSYYLRKDSEVVLKLK